ncbi:resistance to Congo red protein [Geodermatophilus sp. DSM 45219]|uniref:resistance to Congo red protein n=1 Tax=Geodermatophilus sp. DSM 45219 TaxID=1881103 RepID=UPI0008847A54|nr:resistance to Congo red protein [Geodermatophilus sp. DSM 45219]SDO61744.1 hypothetical protein SAMN05428965_4571 [Geodermatophilus sp. DSM 45219]
MSTHDDEPRPGADPRAGQPAPQYGQQPGYGAGGQSGYPQYGQPQYGQPGGYGQYAPQGQYGQYPQGQYGQYGPYGQSPVPARPTPVVVASVLGFVFGALGALMSLAFLLGGALLGTVLEDVIASDPTLADVDAGELGEVTDVALAFAIGAGIAALVWTVLVIWGSVRALTGRSRVLLLVGGGIAVAVTALFLFSILTGLSTGEVGGGEVLFALVPFLGAVAIVVLLCLRPAAQFYAAHRARRAR